MEQWNQKIAGQIQQELKGVKDRDLRFFRIAEYLRMVKRVDDFSDECQQCKQFQTEIERETRTIRLAVTETGKERRNYDRHIDQLARHMKKVHGFYPPYYYTYSLTFFYTLIAAVLGLLISIPFQSIDRWFFIVPGIIVGLMAGQLIGNRKDSKIRSNNKLL
jgi:hypothetical protein